MRADTTIIYRGDSLDPDFINFYYSLDSSNTGKFQIVTELAGSYPDSAETILEQITAGNDIEEQLKSYYHIYFDKIALGYELSSTDSSTLETLLEEATETGGDAYFYILSSLFIERHPTIVSSRLSSKDNYQSPTDQSNPSLKIYPNPASSHIIIEMSDIENLYKVEIFNALGQIQLQKLNFKSRSTVNISDYEAGIYFVKCINDKMETSIQSFSIVK